MSLDSLKASILKKAKGVHVSKMSESIITKRDIWLPTPSYDLNRILSGNLRKGLAEKCFYLIVGPEHSFKSSFAVLSMAEAQKQGYKIVIIDTEGAYDDKFISRWGLNPEEVLYVYTPFVEDAKVVLAQILDSDDDKYGIILDSVGGLDQRKILNDALDGDPKADQGGLAKALKPLYKLLLNIVKVKNSIAIATGHVYGNPGGYGDAETIGGGKALRLLPDAIISIKKSKLYDKDKHVIGNELKATMLKNRLYPPFNEAAIQINYENGINKFAGLSDLAVSAGIVSKGGAGWYTLKTNGDKEIKAQGDDKLMAILAENEDQFINDLNDWISKTGFSNVNTELQTMFGMVEDPDKVNTILEDE